MLKKCTILGLVVLAVGGIVLAWAHYRMRGPQASFSRQGLPNGVLRSQEYMAKYGRWYELAPEEQTRLVLELDNDCRAKTAQQLAQEQQDRLRADLDVLAAGETVPSEIAGYLYGSGWQQEVARYKERNEQTRSIQAAAVACVSFGAGLFGLCSTMALGRLALRSRSVARASCPCTSGSMDAPPPDGARPGWSRDAGAQRPRQQTEQDQDGLATQGRDALATETAAEAEPSNEQPKKRAQRPSIAVECESATADGELATRTEACRVCNAHLSNQPGDGGQCPPYENSSDGVETLEDRAQDVQRQITALKKVTQSDSEVAGKSEPLSATIKRLTEQVTAIRDYASSQQERVNKLQDGYDWGIIRTFCLRVIRCVDNIESRVEELKEAGKSTNHLEEVRDELLFALESSGVEPFEPDSGSDYRGQEKAAEAIKQKQKPGRPDQIGKIAKVIRPGYRYVMDEDNFKIVRAAQVMLFG